MNSKQLREIVILASSEARCGARGFDTELYADKFGKELLENFPSPYFKVFRYPCKKWGIDWNAKGKKIIIMAGKLLNAKLNKKKIA